MTPCPRCGTSSLHGGSNWAGLHNTGQFDVTGHPAISVPCGMADGFPIGMMMVGKHFDDKTVIRVADAFENIGDWREMLICRSKCGKVDLD
jgi:amidase